MSLCVFCIMAFCMDGVIGCILALFAFLLYCLLIMNYMLCLPVSLFTLPTLYTFSRG